MANKFATQDGAIHNAEHYFSALRLEEQPELLTPTDAARLLRVSRHVIYSLIHNGELHAVHVGESVRIFRQSLVDYLHRRVV